MTSPNKEEPTPRTASEAQEVSAQDSPVPATYEQADIWTKTELERQKLLLEIEKLSRPWWKTSEYITALSPVTIALIAFFGAWIAGVFDRQEIELERQRDQLRASTTDAFGFAIDAVFVQVINSLPTDHDGLDEAAICAEYSYRYNPFVPRRKVPLNMSQALGSILGNADQAAVLELGIPL